jgi:hypothetical protein
MHLPKVFGECPKSTLGLREKHQLVCAIFPEKNKMSSFSTFDRMEKPRKSLEIAV